MAPMIGAALLAVAGPDNQNDLLLHSAGVLVVLPIRKVR
jgi:hypothetical protein